MCAILVRIATPEPLVYQRSIAILSKTLDPRKAFLRLFKGKVNLIVTIDSGKISQISEWGFVLANQTSI